MVSINSTEGNDSLVGTSGDDTISGGAGDDTIIGTAGNDSIRGGTGNDSLYGGAGNDSFLISGSNEGTDQIFGGDGTDTWQGDWTNDDFNVTSGLGNLSSIEAIAGGDGYDVIRGTSGNDSLDFSGYTISGVEEIEGGAGNDTIIGTAGNDSIRGGTGNDSLYGGAGNDSFLISGSNEGTDQIFGGDGTDTWQGDWTNDVFNVTSGLGNLSSIEAIAGGDGYDVIRGTSGNDSLDFSGYTISGVEEIDGGAGNDTIIGTAGNDSIRGGTGNDSLYGGAGDDSLTGGDGDDVVLGGTGNDIVSGGTGNDQLFGDQGNDTLFGGAGSDRLDGGAGNDTLFGGAGNDTLTGGEGADVFGFDRSGGADRVTDFNSTLVDGKTVDQLDISELRTQSGKPVNWRDVTVSGDDNGNAVLTFPEGESVVLEGISPEQASGKQNMARMGVPCYAPGTLIDTPDGPRAVETLRAGDLVTTLDHGPQPIRWTRSSNHPLENAEVDAKPVQIKAGALGRNLPVRDLVVSPQHRILVGRSGQLQLAFSREAFAPAKSLTALAGIRHMKGKKDITWIHFACDRHEVVFANGCLSESLLLGPMVINGMNEAEREVLTDIFGMPQTPDGVLNGPLARECLTVGAARSQLSKHHKAKKELLTKEIQKWDDDLIMQKSQAQWKREATSLAQSSDDTRLAS